MIQWLHREVLVGSGRSGSLRGQKSALIGFLHSAVVPRYGPQITNIRFRSIKIWVSAYDDSWVCKPKYKFISMAVHHFFDNNQEIKTLIELEKRTTKNLKSLNKKIKGDI